MKAQRAYVNHLAWRMTSLNLHLSISFPAITICFIAVGLSVRLWSQSCSGWRQPWLEQLAFTLFLLFFSPPNPPSSELPRSSPELLISTVLWWLADASLLLPRSV